MKYNHALFLYPYVESAATSVMKLFPPTGLEYVATSAKDLVNKLTLLDLRYEEELLDIPKLIDFISREIDIVCVSIGWDRQFEQVCEIIRAIPDSITLVAGGYKATEKVEELFVLCPNIDIIVRGEGEDTIKDILRGLELKDIPGISFRQNNTVVHNKLRPLSPVDSLSFPDRSMRRSIYRLTLNGINITNLTFDSILSARGCPFNCKFCTFSLNPLGQRRYYAARNVDSVVKEVESIRAQVVLFSDDNLFAEPKRAEQLCDMLIERKIKKTYIAQARIEISRNPELLAKMVKAGFKVLLIGLESPHDRILKQLNKGFNSQQIRQAFKVLRRFPIYTSGYFIYGNIGETEEEMLYISQFAKEIGVDSIACNKLRIEKFSPLRSLAEETPGYHITDKGELYSDKYSHAALKKIGRRIKFSFYTPQRYMRMLWKNIFVIRFFTFSQLCSVVLVAPRLLKSVILREKKRGRLGDSLKRTFIENK